MIHPAEEDEKMKQKILLGILVCMILVTACETTTEPLEEAPSQTVPDLNKETAKSLEEVFGEELPEAPNIPPPPSLN